MIYTKQKHWFVTRGDFSKDGQYQIKSSGKSVCDTQFSAPTFMGGIKDVEEIKGNVALITHAPEMYELLVKMGNMNPDSEISNLLTKIWNLKEKL